MRAIVVSMGLVLMSFTAHAADWKNYFNDRFGFSVDVPASFKSLGLSANNDGFAFISKDQTAEIRAYGHFIQGENLVEEAREQERFDTNLHVTYRQMAATAFTLTGLTGNRIVYMRAVKTCKGDAAAILRVEYPQSGKAEFDPLIAHMVKTLRGSNDCI